MATEVEDLRPLSLSRFATFWLCEADWEPDGAQGAVIWEPLDIDAPADARPVCGLHHEVSFYDRSGNGYLGKAHHHHMDGSVSPTLLLLGSTWYELTSWKVTYHRGRWHLRWWAHKNTRVARAANAAIEVYRG